MRRLLGSVAAELGPLLVLHAGQADAVNQVLRLHHLVDVVVVVDVVVDVVVRVEVSRR